MSNLSTHLFYRIINESKELVCERVFFEGDRYLSIESKKPLKSFHVLGVSISYEKDVVNLVKMLESSGISSLRKERSEYDPIIIGGGIVPTLNPDPLIPIFDLLVIGEGEDLPEILLFMKELFFKGVKKREIIEGVAEKFDGIIVCEDVQMRWDGGRIEDIRYKKIKIRAKEEEWHSRPAFVVIDTDETEFPGTFVLEVERGCPGRCKFCAVSHNYKFRFRKREEIKSIVKDRGEDFNRVGLMGPGLSFYPELELLVKELLDLGKGISFSSLRVDRVSNEFIDLIPLTGVRTITIAPELGDEEKRFKIGKPIKNGDILDFVDKVKNYIRKLRLYFMYGLPDEEEEDLKKAVGLVKELKRVAGNKLHISASFSPFVPKPRTPMEDEPMERLEILKKKEKLIKKEVGGSFQVHFESSKWSIFQGLLSMGDRRVFPLLREMATKGRNFLHIWKDFDFDPEEILHRKRDELLKPWSYISA